MMSAFAPLREFRLRYQQIGAKIPMFLLDVAPILERRLAAEHAFPRCRSGKLSGGHAGVSRGVVACCREFVTLWRSLSVASVVLNVSPYWVILGPQLLARRHRHRLSPPRQPSRPPGPVLCPTAPQAPQKAVCGISRHKLHKQWAPHCRICYLAGSARHASRSLQYAEEGQWCR